jgi:TolB-like protein/class 3 adenylate cyclase
MPQSRQLAAILFTDIVGYTAMMGHDEHKALSILKANRRIQKPLIDHYHGKWIKEMGDGTLSTFPTVTDAVQCACAILKECKEVDGLELRMGIHLGEVMMEDGDIFGDGVNIASRLQSNAPVGAIWVSEPVHNNISNKKGILTRFVREETLRNVKEPVRVYEVTLDNDAAFAPAISTSPKATSQAPEKSIAVMAFVNMSNDPEQEYFSDGMAEEILNSISHLKDLKVAGRTSSFQFKGSKTDLKEIGEKLGVRSVLEGSVRKQGDLLRVSAQLINVADGFHIWSEKYDRKMENIFAIQDEIAEAITKKLKITFFDNEEEILYRAPTENEEAYELYLKGRFYWNKRGRAMQKGLEYFTQAVSLDPNFGLAHAGIADTWALLGFYNVVAPHIAMAKAREAAEKAIQLDPSLVEAHSALAFVSAFYDWDWTEAKRRFQKVFLINSNYAPVHYWYSLYLAWVEDKYEEAIREAMKAAELEPLVSISHCIISGANLYLGKYDEALKAAQMAVEIGTNQFLAYWYLGNAFIALEKYDEAIEALKNSADLSGRHQWPLADLCRAYTLTGNIPEAEKIMDELVTRSQTEFISGLYLFIVAYSLKKYDEAFDYLERAIEQRDGILLSSRSLPSFRDIRKDPRFRKFWDKLIPLSPALTYVILSV